MIYPTEILEPEQWKPIENIFPEVSETYFISNYGRVYNSKTGRLLPKNINYCKDKYINITLTCKDEINRIQEMMQRLVMYAFRYIDGCELLEVNHKDGVKYHNWVWNLEWSTHYENMVHAYDNKLIKFGEERNNSKLTEKEVHEICLLLEQGFSVNEIEKLFNNTSITNARSTIGNIKSRHCWKNISIYYNIDNSRTNKIEGSTTIENKIITPIEFYK